VDVIRDLFARGEAQHQIEVFEFMVKHNEVKRERWSYYDELITAATCSASLPML